MLATLTARAQQVEVSFDALEYPVEHPAFSATGVKLSVDVFHAGQADVTVRELRLGDSRFRDLKLHCDNFHLDNDAVSCGSGTLRHGAPSPHSTHSTYPPLALSGAYRFNSKALTLTLKDADVAAWSGLVMQLGRLNPSGKFDLTFNVDGDQAKFDFAVRDLAFNTADYGIAGERIAATVSAVAKRAGENWKWHAAMDWSGGEAFWSPWYRKAGVRLTGEGNMTPATIQVDQARLSLDGVGNLTAGLSWDRKLAAVTRWGFVTDPLDLSAAVKEWVQPVLEAHALPAISATGTTRYAAEWSQGALQSFYAGIENATLKEGSGRLTLSGVNASVPWSRSDETAAEISVVGGLLDDFPLGGFRVPLRLHGSDVAISQAIIPFLDGRIRIDDFHAQRPAEDWTGNFSGAIEGVSMPRLTTAMGLPPMVGRLGMRIPSAQYANHVLDLGGDMSIDVFDGRVTVRKLKLIEPLSRASRFVADVEARRLDLGLLTSAFSFGSIVGRLDIDIADLELQDWKPLAFRAHLASSPGNYRRAISRGALIDISALGGAAGAAAVRAIPAAGFLNTFSYDRIGFGCVLKDTICHMDGIAAEGDGYVLVEGSGIPALKVMGYNRSIDWNLLVSRLKAVIAGKTKAVIE